MPQINSGKSPPWVAGEIVTAAELNQMIDAATLDPSAVTSQSNLTTLTGDEYALVVDNAGLLKKTQVKNSLLTGEDIKTDSITQITGSSTTLLIQSNPSVGMLVDGIGSLTLRSQSGNIGIDTTSAGGGGNIAIQSNGMTFDGQGGSATGVINFQTRTIFSNTGAVKIPVGTTAQRPASPVAGDLRFNSTTSLTETYNGSNWSSVSTTRIYTKSGTASGATAPSGGNTVYESPIINVPADETWIYEFWVQTTSGYVNGNTRADYGSVSLLAYNNSSLFATLNGSTSPYGANTSTFTFSKAFTSADVNAKLVLKTANWWSLSEEPKYLIKLYKVKTSSISDASSCI